MSDMWRSRSPPTPLDFDAILDGSFHPRDNSALSTTDNGSSVTNGHIKGSFNGPSLRDQRTLTLKDNLKLFISRYLLCQLLSICPCLAFEKYQSPFCSFMQRGRYHFFWQGWRRYAWLRNSLLQFAVLRLWDWKENAVGSQRFVFFPLLPPSFYLKSSQTEMAGNIIPAIATTNAVISGLIVLQALQLLKQTYSKLRNVHLQFKPSVPLSTIRLSPPNPECGVCRDCYATLQCDTTRTLLGDVVQGILGNDQREVSVYEDKRVLSDPDWVDNFDRTLESLGVTKGKFLSIVDEDGDWSTISVALSDIPWVNFCNSHRIHIEVVSVPIIHTLTYYLHHSPNQPVKLNSRLFQKLHQRWESNDLYR